MVNTTTTSSIKKCNSDANEEAEKKKKALNDLVARAGGRKPEVGLEGQNQRNQNEDNQDSTSDSLSSSSLSSDRDNGMHRISELSESTYNNGDRDSSSSVGLGENNGDGLPAGSNSQGGSSLESGNSSKNKGGSQPSRKSQEAAGGNDRTEPARVNDWLNLLWERPASTDGSAMSQWMSRVQCISKSSPNITRSYRSRSQEQPKVKIHVTADKKKSNSNSTGEGKAAADGKKRKRDNVPASAHFNVRNAKQSFSTVSSMTNSSLSGSSKTGAAGSQGNATDGVPKDDAGYAAGMEGKGVDADDATAKQGNTPAPTSTLVSENSSSAGSSSASTSSNEKASSSSSGVGSDAEKNHKKTRMDPQSKAGDSGTKANHLVDQ